MSALSGKTVALAEGRQLEELAALLQDEGAAVLRCPMLSILDAPDAGPVLAWLEQLIAGEFGLVILMTGEAVRRMAGFAERAERLADYVAALNRARLLLRGPKPAKALRDLGVATTPSFSATPTTGGVIDNVARRAADGPEGGADALRSEQPRPGRLPERSRGGRSAGAVLRFRRGGRRRPRGGTDRAPGRRPRCDRVHLVAASGPVYEVAAKRGLSEQLAAGLKRTKVAAVGPVVAQALRDRGGSG